MSVWNKSGNRIVAIVGDQEIAIEKCERRRSYTTGMATISCIEKYYHILGCKKRFKKLRDAKRYAEETVAQQRKENDMSREEVKAQTQEMICTLKENAETYVSHGNMKLAKFTTETMNGMKELDKVTDEIEKLK